MQYKRERILYFGLDPSYYQTDGVLTHLPLIMTRPFPKQEVISHFSQVHSHVLFTSKEAVKYYFSYTDEREKIFICIGEATAKQLEIEGVISDAIAKEPCAEGVIALLKQLEYTSILYPHSALSRPLLPTYLKKNRGICFPLYTTITCDVVLPDLDLFDRFVFTSPSVVTAFSSLCFALPKREKCEAIGPITQNALNKLFA